LGRFGEKGGVKGRIAEGAFGVVVDPWIGPMAVYFAKLGPHGRLERQSDVGLIRRHAVFVMRSEARSAEVASDCKKGRTRGAKVFRDVHQYVRLLTLHEHVEDVVAQNGVECALRTFGSVMGVVSFDLKSLLPQKVHVGPVAAAVVQHATLDVAEAEEFPGWEGGTVAILGCEMGIGIFAIGHDE